MNKIKIYTDGGARNNPGPAGVGVHIPGVGDYKKYLGEKTNNQAEYEAVIFAFEKIEELEGVEELDFYLDSNLVVEQLNENFKIKNPELAKLFVKIWNLKAKYKRVSFTHIPREENTKADALANQAMDEAK